MRWWFVLMGAVLFFVAGCDGSVSTGDPDAGLDADAADGGDQDGSNPDGGDGPVADGGDDGGQPDGGDPTDDGDAGVDGGDQQTPSSCWEAAPGLSEEAFFVVPGGDDQGPGSQAQPFGSLERARQAIRDRLAEGAPPAGGLSVVLRDGDYALDATFELGADDSGTAEAPVTWRAYPGEQATLSGAASLDAAWFAPVAADDPGFDRLPAATRDQVVVADLGAHGIQDWGSLTRRGAWGGTSQAALELIVDGEPLPLARWPNRGQTDPVDTEQPALVKGDIFGAQGTWFDYLGTDATGNADDGTPNYHGQAAGQDWYLYHCTWEWGGATHRYWFLSGADPQVSADCWPSAQTAWAASGTDPIPVLTTQWGGATEALVVRNRPEDHAQDGFVRVPEAFSTTEFRLPGQRHQAWATEPAPWVHGLFGNYWADDALPVTIAPDGRATLGAEPHYGVVAGQPFWAFNLLAELDEPGEWYLDRDTGRLYLWPPAPLAGARLRVSMAEHTLVRIQSAAHLRFEGLTFEAGRGRQVEATDVDDVIFSRCRFEAAGGGEAVRIRGTGSGLACSRISHPGGTGLRLEGGHRADLMPGGDFVADTEIDHFGRWDRTYHPAVSLAGCGQVVEHCLLHHAPHAAVLYSGNEHRIEYNEIHHVVVESNDAGAIYAGRDWGWRGNLVRYNWFHDILSVFGGSHAVYLDDALSGTHVFGNIMQRVNGLATLSGGGRDNIIENNVMVDIARGAHGTDRRARTSNYDWDGSRPDSWNLLGRLQAVFEGYEPNTPLDHQAEPWASRYPALAAIPDDWPSIADTHWQDPEGCVFSRNLLSRCEAVFVVGTWGGEGATDFYSEIADNPEVDDPGFVDEAGGDLNLRPDSPAFQIPGFEPIPFDQIGPR